MFVLLRMSLVYSNKGFDYKEAFQWTWKLGFINTWNVIFSLHTKAGYVRGKGTSHGSPKPVSKVLREL